MEKTKQLLENTQIRNSIQSNKKKFNGSILDLKNLKSSVAIPGGQDDTYRSMYSDANSIVEADPI